MPKKTCGNCREECGPRTKICKCGFSFEKKIPSIQPVQELPQEPVEPKAAPALNRGKVICTPSELCPVTPQGYRVSGWSEPASDEVVMDWARKAFSAKKDVTYTIEAVIYWARSFWDVHSSDWYRIKNCIYSELSEKSEI